MFFLDMRSTGTAAEKKGYSGTAVFSKVKPLTVTYGLGIEEHDKEGRVITAEYKEFYLVNVYTPNSQRGWNGWITDRYGKMHFVIIC